MKRGRIAVALTLAAAGVAHAQAPPTRSHSDDILALATILAMAQTASDRCADILINNAMVEQAPAYFRVTPEDKTAYQLAARIEMQRLSASIDAAPSLKAWCDAVYRAYGPDGDIAKGLLGK